MPGRLIPLHMDPLLIQEIPQDKLVLENLLLFCSLPEILLEDDFERREENLEEAYVSLF